MSRQTGAYLRHAVCPRSLLRKCLDEALDVFRDRFVFLRRSQFRQHVGVCEHVEAERSGERSALNAEPADVLCGRLLNAESEEVPGGEGLEVFDFLHDVQAIKKPPAVAEGCGCILTQANISSETRSRYGSSSMTHWTLQATCSYFSAAGQWMTVGSVFM